jgi:hypothetical protein
MQKHFVSSTRTVGVEASRSRVLAGCGGACSAPANSAAGSNCRHCEPQEKFKAGQLTLVWTLPATFTVTTPPKEHIHWESSVSAGEFAIMVFGAPGVHGNVIAGMHGPGVSTPSAAAVSPAVAGLARLVHTPKGTTLTNGLLSMMFAAGRPSTMTLLVGKTFNTEGAAPNEHCVTAAATTGEPMATRYRRGAVWASSATEATSSVSVLDQGLTAANDRSDNNRNDDKELKFPTSWKSRCSERIVK